MVVVQQQGRSLPGRWSTGLCSVATLFAMLVPCGTCCLAVHNLKTVPTFAAVAAALSKNML